VLVELLLAFTLEVDLVRVTVLRLEAYRRSNVEVMHEASDVEKHRMPVLYACVSATTRLGGQDQTYFSDTKELDRRFTTMQDAFFSFNLLEDQLLGQLIEVIRQRWSAPLLVLFCVALFQLLHVLCHLLQCLFELAGRHLTRVERAVGHLDRRASLASAIVELQLLCRAGRGQYVGAVVRGVGEGAFRRRPCYCARHLGSRIQRRCVCVCLEEKGTGGPMLLLLLFWSSTTHGESAAD
jgi:hypothetical protein